MVTSMSHVFVERLLFHVAKTSRLAKKKSQNCSGKVNTLNRQEN